MKLFWKLDLFGLITALALPALAYWTQVSPAIQRNRAAAATIQQLDQQRLSQADLQQTLNSLSNLTKAMPATTQASVNLEPLSNLNRRLGELTDLASRHGLTIDALEPADAVSRDRYATTSINLTALGSYRSFQSWMSDLHTAMPDVSIVQWQLVSVTTDKNPQVKLSSTLRWYALPKAGSH